MTCMVLPKQHLQPDAPIGARVQAPSTAVPTMLAPNGASKPLTKCGFALQNRQNIVTSAAGVPCPLLSL